MSYLVLARKYRPRDFDDFVGQAHVVTALKNAFTNARLHHAYLLTGTRGVGKTTLARILAKCFNCHKGITADPCGKCPSCEEISAGCSLDLLEIDAASNTKVEDTRDILDNLQYAPSRDRFKIYLIDEVHMLSGHSFNALLKTLEEPPEHVKFILATTDPQKLPITVLSRCLQFNLRALSTTQISTQLQTVLTQEKLSAEQPALISIAQAAKGSMRDALSLLDQAIAFSNNQVTSVAVNQLLGIANTDCVLELIEALAENNPVKVFNLVETLAEQAIDYEQILDTLLSYLQQIALKQVLPDFKIEEPHTEASIIKLTQLIQPEDLQLYYQIALIGRRDLQLAPAPKAGFEMLLLRMLNFTPETRSKPAVPRDTTAPIKPAAKQPATTHDKWPTLLKELKLTGMNKLLAEHSVLRFMDEEQIELDVDPTHAAMANNAQQLKLQQALENHLGRKIHLKINKTEQKTESPAKQALRIKEEKQQEALENLQQDPNVQALVSQFDANIKTESITLNN